MGISGNTALRQWLFYNCFFDQLPAWVMLPTDVFVCLCGVFHWALQGVLCMSGVSAGGGEGYIHVYIS